MKSIIKLLKSLVPTDWGDLARKGISITLLASLLAYGYHLYRAHEEQHLDDLVLHDLLLERPDIKDDARQLIAILANSHPEISSVWVYSWPDARNLEPVLSVGSLSDPIPMGYFWNSDYQPIGHLVLGVCAPLERPTNNLACPIEANNDMWGVVVVTFHEGTTISPQTRNSIITLVHKLSLVIYYD